MKNVKLVLEYDLGDFNDEYHISKSLETWYEYIYQSAIDMKYLKIKKVIINDTTEMEE